MRNRHPLLAAVRVPIAGALCPQSVDAPQVCLSAEPTDGTDHCVDDELPSQNAVA